MQSDVNREGYMQTELEALHRVQSLAAATGAKAQRAPSAESGPVACGFTL